MTGILYIVATPIGNMQDISFRALQALLKADVIACEDTRRAGLLLQKVKTQLNKVNKDQPLSSFEQRLILNQNEGKKPRLLSYYDQVEKQKVPEIITLLLQGLNVVLISDAGTPLISDPGFRLVREAISEGIQVESIPGPSAVITALTISGLPTDKFFFLGYLPKKTGHRKELLESVKNLKRQLKTTIIFFEAPHRIEATLEELKEILGEKKHIVVARELTKIYEDVQRGSVKQLRGHFQKTKPKGEFVILFNTEE